MVKVINPATNWLHNTSSGQTTMARSVQFSYIRMLSGGLDLNDTKFDKEKTIVQLCEIFFLEYFGILEFEGFVTSLKQRSLNQASIPTRWSSAIL